MKSKLMTTVFLSLGLLVLSACGAQGVGLTDPSILQGALESGTEATGEVDEDCLVECIDKGESEDDCTQWCSYNKGKATGEVDEDCLVECIDKGESEDDCTQWCGDFDKSDCDKGDWEDKDDDDYEDK